MTTMNIKRFLQMCAVIVTAVSYVGCQTPDEGGIINIVYENKSTHSIEVVRTDFTPDRWTEKFPEGFVLAPNGRYEIKNVLSPVYCSVYGKAKFDDSILVDYTSLSESEYNITLVQYFKNITDSKKRFYRYTSTFTDADYQYALEIGQKLEY